MEKPSHLDNLNFKRSDETKSKTNRAKLLAALYFNRSHKIMAEAIGAEPKLVAQMLHQLRVEYKVDTTEELYNKALERGDIDQASVLEVEENLRKLGYLPPIIPDNEK